MNDKQNDIQTTEDADFAPEDRNPAEAEAAAPKRRGNGVAWLAMLIAAAALLAVGYTLFLDWQNAGEPDASASFARSERVEQHIEDTAAAMQRLDDRFGDISHPDHSEKIDAVRDEIDEKLAILGSLPTRMATLEDSVASLAGISAGARQTFLLAEAEYYLQIANAQLQLANNPELASLALGMADERVMQLSDPGLTAVRRAMSDEMAALEVMEKPDLEGATLTLASLARVVESLPLASEHSEAAADAEIDPDESGMQRAWGSVKDAMSGLVRVTPPDQAKLARLSPDAEYFLRNNLALQLQSARLALLRGEQAIFEQTLDDTTALIKAYFDEDSEQVSSALLTLAEIRSDVFTAPVPDISNSLRLLRQFRALRETNE